MLNLNGPLSPAAEKTGMALMDRAATSLSQELGSLARQQLSARTALTLSFETTAAATLDAASQTGASSMHQDGRIRVRWYRGERTLAACICHRHTGPSPSMMNNARPHVFGIVWTFLDTENVRQLPWPARSPDLSPIENVWSMVAQRLARYHTPVTTVDEMGYGVEAA
ncbi:uncharacterized protein TNCV_1507321 [Trichonephila clavipes]|nr:uncharacterized protein TNCV_1507321 [Trichonephila clavipes]